MGARTPASAPAAPPRLGPGMRQTRQRHQIWAALQRLGGHCTAETITAELAREKASVPRSTVYRTLDALSASGALRAIRLPAGPVYYEMSVEDHEHAVCQVCAGITHIDRQLVRGVEKDLLARHGFRTSRIDVIVLGVCQACAAAPDGLPAPAVAAVSPVRG